MCEKAQHMYEETSKALEVVVEWSSFVAAGKVASSVGRVAGCSRGVSAAVTR